MNKIKEVIKTEKGYAVKELAQIVLINTSVESRNVAFLIPENTAKVLSS